MIIRLLSAALAAGFIAAVVVTGLELTLTSPLILAAERYERAEPSHQAAKTLPIVLAHSGHDHSDADKAGPDRAAPEWQPGAGLPRMAFTALATLVGGVGYALLLGAVMLACGREPTARTCLAFAIAGFASVALAPGLGLPPELPGSEAAPLAARQAWWVMTAAATGMGLYLIAIRRSFIAILGGLILMIIPHMVGAPQAPAGTSELPAALAAQFASRSLAIGFVLWVMIGLGFGWAWHALARDAARGAARA